MNLTDKEFVDKYGPLECWPDFKIDIKPLARGFYDMIDELPECYTNAIAFGMLPAPLMEMIERNIKDKMLELCCKSYGMAPTDDNKSFFVLPPHKLADLNRAISVEILHVANEKGVLFV